MERLQYSDFWLVIIFAGQHWPTAQNDNADNMLYGNFFNEIIDFWIIVDLYAVEATALS